MKNKNNTADILYETGIACIRVYGREKGEKLLDKLIDLFKEDVISRIKEDIAERSKRKDI